MLIIVHPTYYISERTFEKTEPSGERYNPEIFISRDGAERVRKLYRYYMSFRPDNLFLRVHIYKQGQEKSHGEHRRKKIPVNFYIAKRVFAGNEPRQKRQKKIGYGRREIIYNGFYGRHVGTFYRKTQLRTRRGSRR